MRARYSLNPGLINLPQLNLKPTVKHSRTHRTASSQSNTIERSVVEHNRTLDQDRCSSRTFGGCLRQHTSKPSLHPSPALSITNPVLFAMLFMLLVLYLPPFINFHISYHKDLGYWNVQSLSIFVHFFFKQNRTNCSKLGSKLKFDCVRLPNQSQN